MRTTHRSGIGQSGRRYSGDAQPEPVARMRDARHRRVSAIGRASTGISAERLVDGHASVSGHLDARIDLGRRADDRILGAFAHQRFAFVQRDLDLGMTLVRQEGGANDRGHHDQGKHKFFKGLETFWHGSTFLLGRHYNEE
ncbi:hypothetical protein EMIT0158MI4_110004 [Burkholderia ambifaria]